MIDQKHYKLVGTEIVECDLIEWAEYLEKRENRIARAEKGDILVSTVFLGIDHGFGSGAPVLFETITFKDGDEIDCERCCTYAEAEKQHLKACEKHLLASEESS